MENVQFGFIKEQYFQEHSDFVNVPDSGNTNKQSKRTHLCVLLDINNNKVFIPLRNNLEA